MPTIFILKIAKKQLKTTPFMHITIFRSKVLNGKRSKNVPIQSILKSVLPWVKTRQRTKFPQNVPKIAVSRLIARTQN